MGKTTANLKIIGSRFEWSYLRRNIKTSVHCFQLWTSPM